MDATDRPAPRPGGLATAYAGALRAYVDAPQESGLADAYEFGREALAAEYGLLDLVAIHHAALIDLLRNDRPASRPLLSAAGNFLLQAVSPFAVLQATGRESTAALRRLNLLVDSEAKRIAQALHDDASQLLAAAYLELAGIRRTVAAPVKERIDRVTSQLDQAREQLRHISHELRPPMLDRLGLERALEHLSDGLRLRNGFRVHLQLQNLDHRLPPEIEDALYRVIQEALANAVRHAGTKAARVELSRRCGAITCTVSDTGIGFDPPAVATSATAGLGLTGMRERIRALDGDFVVDSAPGRGTRIKVKIPLPEKR